MIAAVNGRAHRHVELAVLCDIVLAAEHTTFQAELLGIAFVQVEFEAAWIAWWVRARRPSGRTRTIRAGQVVAESQRLFTSDPKRLLGSVRTEESRALPISEKLRNNRYSRAYHLDYRDPLRSFWSEGRRGRSESPDLQSIV